MRLPLSNGCYIDPCNPALLYDSPDEPQGETVKLSQAEKDRMELDKKIEKLKSYVDELTRKDAHFD
jgi:hypothetical protein